jgi:hypothetical protein
MDKYKILMCVYGVYLDEVYWDNKVQPCLELQGHKYGMMDKLEQIENMPRPELDLVMWMTSMVTPTDMD